MATAPPPGTRRPDLSRVDPWSGQRLGGLRWFAFSTLLHVGLLFLLATVTLTVIRKAQEIRVKVVDDAALTQEEVDGAPSLRDLAGVLKMEAAMPQKAAPSGPVIQGVRAPDLPHLAGLGPKLGTGPAVSDMSTHLSFGSGAIGGLGGGFGDYVGGLRKVGLDVALVIDTTDSMQFVIDDVKAKLSELVETLQRMVPTSRVGIVVYRDKGDDYVVKWTDLSFHTQKLQEFLSHINADGGGDWEEAVKGTRSHRTAAPAAAPEGATRYAAGLNGSSGADFRRSGSVAGIQSRVLTTTGGLNVAPPCGQAIFSPSEAGAGSARDLKAVV